MSEIVVKHRVTEENCSKGCFESVFAVTKGDYLNEILGEVDYLSLNPLRFLEHELIKKKIKVKRLMDGPGPWDIEELIIEAEKCEEIEKLLEDIMYYRCHSTNDRLFEWEEIIGPMPYQECMSVSDDIMNYGKKEEDIVRDRKESDRNWRIIAEEAKRLYGLHQISTKPNADMDNLTIDKKSPDKRIHLIYTSSQGGYNIKTQGYYDSSKSHYGWYETKKWD